MISQFDLFNTRIVCYKASIQKILGMDLGVNSGVDEGIKVAESGESGQ